MQRTGIPNGVGGVGYNASDTKVLAEGAWAQQRLIRNAPKAVTESDLERLFGDAMRYW
jgi:alcohol dehydrogenase class IV